MRTKSPPVPRGTIASSRSRPGEAVRDLVDRAVAADRDEQRRAALDRRARQLAQMPGLLGEERVARQPERGGAAGELGPAAPGRAACGGRIDEEDGPGGANAARPR